MSIEYSTQVIPVSQHQKEAVTSKPGATVAMNSMCPAVPSGPLSQRVSGLSRQGGAMPTTPWLASRCCCLSVAMTDERLLKPSASERASIGSVGAGRPRESWRM